MALLTAAYAMWGHALISYIYRSDSFPLANFFFEGKNTFPLSVYLRTGDAYLAACVLISVLFLIPATFILHSDVSEKLQWTAAGLFMFMLVMLFCFKPHFAENETVYLINPRRLLNPRYLSHDWTWIRGAYTHLVFDLLVAPFTLIMNDLMIAMFGRILVWAMLISALLSLAKTLGLKWWEATLGFFFWLCSRQCLAAGEWIFHSFEAKCVAYFFLFRAIDHMLNDRWIKTALNCGLALSFHFLVGFWGSFAVLMTFLASQTYRKSMGDLYKPLIAFLVTAFPGAFTAILYKLKSGPVNYQEYALTMFLQGPHHFDPSYFLTTANCFQILLCSAAVFWMIPKTYQPDTAKKLIVFLSTLLIFFIPGLAAYKFSVLSFLYLSPFRLGPVFLPLLFSLTVFKFLRMALVSQQNRFKLQGVAFGLLVFFLGTQYQAPSNLLRRTAGFVFDWRNALTEKYADDFEEAAAWIQANTPEDSIFIAPPWEYRFWILTHRAQIASFKYFFVDRSIHEWYARMKALNRDMPFKNRSARIHSEFKYNYPLLTTLQLKDMKEQYGATYYFTTTLRPDLLFPLIYKNKSFFLYHL